METVISMMLVMQSSEAQVSASSGQLRTALDAFLALPCGLLLAKSVQEGARVVITACSVSAPHQLPGQTKYTRTFYTHSLYAYT